MKGNFFRKGEEHLRYNLNNWVKKGIFGILNEISENITLVQLTKTLVNVDHYISIVGYWIFDSNYEKSLNITR